MRDIFAFTDAWSAAGEEMALATLVRVSGSAPRRPGARLLLSRSGRMEGSVSGGCVENDVYERALTVLDSGEPTIAAYGISDEMGLSVGLSCGGNIDVLIEPWRDSEATTTLRTAVENERPAVMATVIEPQEAAARKLLVDAEGNASGTIAPDADEAIARRCRSLISEEGARIETIASVSVFIETFAPSPRLLLVGATHTAGPLTAMARQAGFRVTLIDPRQLFAREERFPDAHEILCEWPERALKQTAIDEFSYVVVLAHDPKFDLPALEAALRSPARYIGAMGSRKTHAQRRERLHEMGFSDEILARIHAPIGLDIGARKPEEIAVAILAEMIAARYRRSAADLSEPEQAV